ncbi:ABC transporter ATP-binding protein [Glaciecola sp. SC05]|uniref:ABC transporter ATP-binding protein n=1 Tax=Glaciecola sp. SC05 TaxID=1987355 RepID=UPI003526E4CA
MICVNNLTKVFGDSTVVDDLSFEVNAGEVVGFLGPNGAGKSTTMKMLMGFLSITSGSVQINGKDILDAPLSIRKDIGYLPEGAPAYTEMTVYQFLTFIAQARGIPSKQRKQAILDVAEKVALKNVLNKTIDTLSKGFKRRVGIAQAMIHDPKILILDEPTDGLDPNQKHQVRKLIKDLAEDKIVIISTHILEEVSALCNRVMIIAEGEMRFDGTPQELLLKSKHHNAVSMQMRGLADISGLLELEGVADLHYDRQNSQITLFADAGTSIVEPVSAFIYENQLPVESFYQVKGSFDDVFREVTQSREGTI